MAATATEKVTTTLQINKLLTIAAASKVQRKFEKGAGRPSCEAENLAHLARDRQASDIILSMGHTSDPATPDPLALDGILGKLSHAKSGAQRCRVGDYGFAVRDFMDGILVHVLPWPCLGFIAYRDPSCWLSPAPVDDFSTTAAIVFRRSSGERLDRPRHWRAHPYALRHGGAARMRSIMPPTATSTGAVSAMSIP